MLENVDVGERIAVDRDQIGGEAGRDPSDLILDPEQPRRAGGGGGERFGGREPRLA